MSIAGSSSPTLIDKKLIDTKNLEATGILSLFRQAEEFQENFSKHGIFKAQLPERGKKLICCVFFEPSTRTRMSFQIAAERLGVSVSVMETQSSSLVKGESYVDSILNLAAMKPDALVVRYGLNKDLDQLLPKLTMPVINAGSGVTAHPTQGLLDAYTIYRERKKFEGQKVVIIGDILHSRVARSTTDVLLKLGAQVAFCGPEHFMPEPHEFSQIKKFTSLNEALDWCNVCMGLRIQLERHDAADLNSLSIDDYHSQFGVTERHLKVLKPETLILHPGPVNVGVEFAPEVLKDSRSRILTQVTNGVFIRAAVIASLLNL